MFWGCGVRKMGWGEFDIVSGWGVFECVPLVYKCCKIGVWKLQQNMRKMLGWGTWMFLGISSLFRLEPCSAALIKHLWLRNIRILSEELKSQWTLLTDRCCRLFSRAPTDDDSLTFYLAYCFVLRWHRHLDPIKANIFRTSLEGSWSQLRRYNIGFTCACKAVLSWLLDRFWGQKIWLISREE